MTGCRIVIPCFNEARRLDAEALLECAQRSSIDFVLVDSGSSDATLALLQSIEQRRPESFSVVALGRNLGKAEAVRQGMLRALADDPQLVGFWDADLATPLADIDRFRRTFDNDPQLQMVTGARVRMLGRQVHRRPVRHVLGRLFAAAAACTLRLPMYDTQCGAKMFRAGDPLRQALERPFRTRWVFDVELIGRLTRLWASRAMPPAERLIYEAPLEVWRDVPGSKLRPWHFVQALWELTVVWFSIRFSRTAAPRSTPTE